MRPALPGCRFCNRTLTRENVSCPSCKSAESCRIWPAIFLESMTATPRCSPALPNVLWVFLPGTHAAAGRTLLNPFDTELRSA
jgi:hypothetical protein